ncbi:MAG: ABC transporter permease [Defluviitaleaceae bacterium]|nr:ABC transporter permease [Defluviitaleaceae bacterium]MCL2835843.1 ABC transporter permease [Defluviitaleaceae bacterium]
MDTVEKSTFSLKSLVSRINVPTLIVLVFWIFIMILGVINNVSLTSMITDSIGRFGALGILSLAMVPSIQSGTGPNFALPIGMVCGLLGMVCAIQFGFTSWGWLIISILLSVVFACIIGYGYGILMNAVKGSEMTIATYTGWAFVWLFSMLWVILPFTDLRLRLPLGQGLRQDIQLAGINARNILTNSLSFDINGIFIPTGMILFFFLCCFLVWMFMRSKKGIAITAGGTNPMFAGAAGLHVNRNRIYAGMLSMVLGAVGTVIYAQHFGFIQLYLFPMMFAFIAVAAVMIGGATVRRANITHVIVGVLIFQGLSANMAPVANAMFPGTDIPEALRTIVQNGIILYALMHAKGGGGK